MKPALIVYHSRSGHSRSVAAELSRYLDADREEVINKIQKPGLRSYLASAWSALTRKPAPIKPPEFPARQYPLVIIGGPTWASHVSAPVLSWLDQEGTQLGRYAAWVTQGGSGGEKVLKQLEEEIGHAPVATLVLTDKEIESGEFKSRIADFADRLDDLTAG